MRDICCPAGWRDASDLAERALQLSRTHKERGHEAWALKLLGDVALGHNPPKTQQAESYYRHASAVSLELGMRTTSSTLPRRIESHSTSPMESWSKARGELSAAIDLYRSLEMTFWLPGTEAAFGAVIIRIDGEWS